MWWVLVLGRYVVSQVHLAAVNTDLAGHYMSEARKVCLVLLWVGRMVILLIIVVFGIQLHTMYIPSTSVCASIT